MPMSFAFNDKRFIFLFLSMLTGLMGAFVHPLMSYFIVDELGSPPYAMGLYMFAVTITGLVFSQFMGSLVDKGSSAKKMYLIAIVGMSLALIIYANTYSFLVVLIVGVLFMSLGNAAIPQMLTLGHQWASHTKVDMTPFNAQVRAAISFAWIGGPPLAFSLVSFFGFSGSFYFSAAVGLIALIFVLGFVPEFSKPKSNRPQKSTSKKMEASFWLLTIAVLLGAMCNIMYSSSLPLYMINEHGFSTYVPGLLMGIVAALEIPIMIFSSHLAKNYSKSRLIMFSFVCAMVFYTGIFFATELWQFILLQCINGIYYGLYAGLGLTLMQEQSKDNVGFVSAVYSNAMRVGMMFGTAGAGLIAQFQSFQFANIGAMLTALAAILCLILFNALKKEENLADPKVHSAV